MVKNRGLIGHVDWNDGTPASDLTVKLIEKDFVFDDVLPSEKTDKKGNFIISYHPEIYGGKGKLGEKPDVELSINYISSKNQEKIFKKYYKSIKEEWLRVDIKLEDQPSIRPIAEKPSIPTGIFSKLVNLNDCINLEDIKKNKIWEIFISPSIAFSTSSMGTVVKFASWGGNIVVGNIFDGPLSRDEKNLNSKGVELLNDRKNKPKKIELEFIWLDENNNVLHNFTIKEQNINYLAKKGFRILVLKPNVDIEIKEYYPVESLKVLAKVQIEEKTFDFEVFCLKSIRNYKDLIV